MRPEVLIASKYNAFSGNQEYQYGTHFQHFWTGNCLHYKGLTLTHSDGTVTASETQIDSIVSWQRLHGLNVVTSDFQHNSW